MNTKYNTVFAMLLRELSIKIKKLSHSDITNVIEGKAEILLQVANKDQVSKGKIPAELMLDKYAQNLNNITSREEGISYLKTHLKNKTQLKVLAKHLDILISKSDKIDHIVEKIIDSTIGYRLRSAAIQNSDKASSKINKS